MVDFITPNTGPTDPDDISTAAIAFIQNQFPNWQPADGNLEVWQIMALARIVSIAAQVAATVPLKIFEYFGRSIIGLSPINALAANATTTWTMNDISGYTIPAGTNVSYATAGDSSVAFETVADVVVPPGSSVTATGGVQIIALIPGSAANGLGPAGLSLTDALSFVASVTAVSATTGGIDAETDIEYAQRLAAELQLATATPILGEDFAVLARNVPGVFRATGIDNYNPADGTTNNERMVAVAAIDKNGVAVSSTVKTAIAAYLAGFRETNFILNTFDPTDTAVNVVFTITPFAGYDGPTVVAAALEAVSVFLSPATWGVDPNDASGTTWTNTTTVMYNSLIGAILNVPGVRWVNTLTIGGASTDFALTGKATLPTVGTVTGSVA